MEVGSGEVNKRKKMISDDKQICKNKNKIETKKESQSQDSGKSDILFLLFY